MRYTFVCFFSAVPPESGAGRVSYDLARFVPGERTLIQLGTSDKDWSEASGLRVIQFQQDGDGRWDKLCGIPRFVRRVVEQLKASRTDVVVLEGASWVLYIWLLLRAIRKALPRLKVVYHAHNVEYLLRREKHGRLVCGLTRWTEGRLLRSADHSFAVSEVDRDAFDRLYGVRPALLPNGIDISQFSEVSEKAIQTCRERYDLDANTVLFMGSYAYKPNGEAIDFLITQVMPMVLERKPNARLAIIGGDVPYHREWLRCPGVIPDEWVAPFVQSCVVSVAPIFSGSGTRLKILTSLAAGIPVVTTVKGAEGLHVTNNEEVLLSSGADEFAENIIRLLGAPYQRIEMGSNGMETVEEKYYWKLLATDFHRQISSVILSWSHSSR